jgi:hypothetical protein
MQARFASYRTFVVDDGEHLIRGDQKGRFILEGGGGDNNARVLWDGAHLTVDDEQLGVPDQPARSFGAAVDAAVAAAVTEAHAGFPNTQFLEEVPSSAGYTRAAALEHYQLWRRLDFPGADDEGVKIFVEINQITGDLNQLWVIDGSGQLLRVPGPLGRLAMGFEKWTWDVPIEDDLDRPEHWLSLDVMHDPTKTGNAYFSPESMRELEPFQERFLPYHLRFDRYTPPFRADLSTGATPPPPSPQVEAAYLLWQGSCTAGAVHTISFHWVWRPEPSDLDWQGVPAAVAGGCPIRLEMHPRARSELAAGSTSRIEATYQVKNRISGTVLVTTPVDLARSGPGKDQSDLSFVTPVSMLDPSELELVFDGTAALTCGSASSTLVQLVGLVDLDDRTLPRLRWDGCMPEPPARE